MVVWDQSFARTEAAMPHAPAAPQPHGNPARPGRLKGRLDASMTTLRRPLHVST